MTPQNFSPRTINMYCSILEYFLRYCEKHFPSEKINDDLVRKYLLKRLNESWYIIQIIH